MCASGGPLPRDRLYSGDQMKSAFFTALALVATWASASSQGAWSLALGDVFSLDSVSNKKTNCVADGDEPRV